ncbi:MAG: zinc-binding alcohol dehydrogenase [Chloroflexota bacterium]
MRARQVLFPEPGVARLVEFEFDDANLAPNEVVIANAYSLISPGTELACLRRAEGWARLPFVPGYASVGTVLALGGAVRHVRPGDRALCYGKHASHVRVNRLVVPVPEGLDLRRACFGRMAAVSMTAVRVAQPELGDWAAVMGLGLVGNLCAQLLTLSGCQVIGIDVESARLALAHACDVAHVVNSRQDDPLQTVLDITHGAKCDIVVDATGLSPVVAQAVGLAGRLGQVILLGSPRDAYVADLTPVLQQVHLWGNGCVTLKGAHEWRYPAARDPNGSAKHSIERNLEILLGLIADERLHVDTLLTHVLPPGECARAYTGLRDAKDEYVGVLFDWAAA